MAASVENAEAALVIGNRLLERAAKIDAALATAREEMLAYKRDVDALHLTGCAAPTAQQFLTFGGLGGDHIYDASPRKGRSGFSRAARATHFY